jgi:Ca2+-binding EF-hand superfamily protein
MKTMMWCLVSGVALATTAYAGDDETKHGSGQTELQMMDTDHDGTVSATEHAAGAKKMFQMMDKDGDGIVTAAEMSAAHKDMPTARSAQAPDTHMDKSSAAKIKAIDADQDGTISAAEHEAGARKMFDKMDKDHNGKLSAAELQAGHDQMMRTAEDQ